MMTRTIAIFFLGALFFFGCRETEKSEAFAEIFALTKQKDYFTAHEKLQEEAPELAPWQRSVLEALIFNAFNQIDKSNEAIRRLGDEVSNTLPDSISLALLDVQHDNAAKTYQYRKAKEALSRIIDQHASLLSAEQSNDYRNSQKLWTILQDQPRQQVVIAAPLTMQMTKDAAGLNNLSVSVDGDTVDFIFDTGANI